MIEYVRGPMRIAAAPVASANPNDAGVGAPRRGKKRGRWERWTAVVAAAVAAADFRGDRPRFDSGRPRRSAVAAVRRAASASGSTAANGQPGERRSVGVVGVGVVAAATALRHAGRTGSCRNGGARQRRPPQRRATSR